MMPGLDKTHILTKHPGVHAFVLLKEDLPGWWDTIEPFIARSVAHSQGTVTVEGIKESLCEGVRVCIGAAYRGEPFLVAVLRPVSYQTYIAARIEAIAGRNIKQAACCMPVIAQWARDIGAVELEAWCRPAVVRLLQRWGWKPKFTIVTLDLRRNLQ